jgi:hypothetical protein
MKKVFLSLMLAGAVAGSINAQESVGGIPWSISKKVPLENSKVPVLSLPTPDFAKALKEDEYNESIGKPGKYRAALGVKANINLSSGNFTYLNDGSIIWRLQTTVPSSVALKIQYDNFVLPEGVTYFVQNGNKSQLIGGFDNTSNPNAESMAHDVIQGDVVNMEMDIKPGVDINKIQFQINWVYGLYRGANSINNTFADANVQATYGLGESDTCQINLNCPQAGPWYLFSSAVAHIWITSSDTAGATGGWCSGTLIGNTAKDCKAYFLTASHCDGDNAYSSPHFKFWEFTFDFRAPLCAGGGTSNKSKVLKGADFKARSFYTIPAGQTTGPLYGDFLLLQLKDPTNKLSEWNRYLAGWDRTNKTNADTVWIGLHHPSGDVMKFTRFNKLDSMGKFNTDSLGTHWKALQIKGGIQPGSSGSGLWQGTKGRLIGDLSGGPTPTTANICKAGNESDYSKIYHNWYNTYDSTYHFSDSVNATNSRLAPFLDPLNTNALTLDMASVNPTCTLVPFTYNPALAINNAKLLENSVFLYPNPSTGIVTMTLNLEKSQDLNVEIVNILGQKQRAYTIKNASLNQQANFDLSNYSNGIYLFRISSENATITKKIIIKK